MIRLNKDNAVVRNNEISANDSYSELFANKPVINRPKQTMEPNILREVSTAGARFDERIEKDCVIEVQCESE